MQTVQNVYPRLERRKLKRIEAGKRKRFFYSMEERADYTEVFFKHAKKYYIDGAGIVGGNAVTEFPNIPLTAGDLVTLNNAWADGCLPVALANLVQSKHDGTAYSYRSKPEKWIVKSADPKKKEKPVYGNFFGRIEVEVPPPAYAMAA